MIATQYIASSTAKPISHENYETVNVLKWNNSKWKCFSPYYLKTDGNESCSNKGNVLFENFYQSCKIYKTVYSNKVYPSRFHMNKEKYLWWNFETANSEGDVLLDETNMINYELYFRWRDSLCSCVNPIRYPNRFERKGEVEFTLVIDKENIETRLDYITARKEIYMKEYIRLVKQLPQYNILLEKLKNNKNVMLCEIDVPSKNKQGNYFAENDFCELTLEKLNLLLEDTTYPFGHGLCLAYSLLQDLNNKL